MPAPFGFSAASAAFATPAPPDAPTAPHTAPANPRADAGSTPLSRRALVVGGSALLLAACGSVAAPPGDAFYRLDVTQPPQPPIPRRIQPDPRSIEVLRFAAQGVLADRAVAHTTDGQSLEQYAYHFWVEPPPLLLQRQVVEYLRAANAYARVVTPDLRVGADLSVRGRLLRFEHLRPENTQAAVAVSLELSILDSLTDDVRLLATYAETQPAEDASIPAAVRAMTGAVRRILDRFVRDAVGP